MGHGRPSPERSARHAGPACFVPILSAALLWLSHFPVAWGWLGWVGLVPLLCLVRLPMRRRRRYFIAWITGLGFFVPAIQWMRVAHDMMIWSWLALAFYCSVFFPIGIALVRQLDRRRGWPLAVTVPLVWAALEFFRSTLGGGFAWYLLGHTQQAFLPVTQISDLGGTATVTALVAAVNGLLAEAVLQWWGCPGSATVSFRRPAIGVGLLMLAALAYGGWRLGQDQFAPGPRVALVQCNTPQGVRNDSTNPNATEIALRELTNEYFTLMAEAVRQTPKPDLIVWPETSHPINSFLHDPAVPFEQLPGEWRTCIELSRKEVANAGLLSGTRVLLGLNISVYGAGGSETRYNSALLVDKYGATLDRYDKVHRVPFGEYIPFQESLPWMSKFAPYEGFEYGIAAGDRLTRFTVNGHDQEFRFGVLICYEDSDAALARAYLREPKVDFLVNISNDGWFRCTAEHEEHLAISRFRAIECRRSLVRAVNMGISAVIDGNGRVVNQIPKGIPGVLAADVPIDSRTSLYAMFGDWLPWSCWGIMTAAMLWRPWSDKNVVVREAAGDRIIHKGQ